MPKTEPAIDLRWLALSLSPHLGASAMENLLRYFQQDLAAIFAASPAQLQRVPGIGPRIAADIAAIDLPRLQRELSSWQAAGLRLLARDGAGYPARLAATRGAPPLLFARGMLESARWERAVAIVGTRQPTRQARYLTLQLAMKLARAGCAVISGLALGVDTAAHRSALTAGGSSIAVLGSGLCNIYPESNRALARQICASGALVSETHPRWGVNSQRLVARNRIISGLARAVLVIESAQDGGAMHTARFAAEQGRPLYTYDLPASGNQALLRAGARKLPIDGDPLAALTL